MIYHRVLTMIKSIQHQLFHESGRADEQKDLEEENLSTIMSKVPFSLHSLFQIQG